MQPAPPERACFLHAVVGGLLLAGTALGSAGCTDPIAQTEAYSPFGHIDTIATTEAPRDSALALLTSINRAAFDSAFARLDEYGVTRHVRTEQFDTTGTVTAHRILTLRYPPGTDAGVVQRADSAGSFRKGGLFSSLTPTRQRTSRPADLSAQALPDQPPYLAPRTREAYRYALRPDSLVGGSPTYVLEAKARSEETGADQSVRYARLTIDRTSRELVGLTTVRANRVLLFRENSQLTVRLRSTPSGAWVPHVTRFRAVVKVPFRAPRQFRTVSAYHAYDRRQSPSGP